jgi:predicted exporter
MYERVAGAAASLVGIVLGALTTFLSFGLLAVSSTPAIANFGMAVALGVGFSLLWAPWIRPPATP